MDIFSLTTIDTSLYFTLAFDVIFIVGMLTYIYQFYQNFFNEARFQYFLTFTNKLIRFCRFSRDFIFMYLRIITSYYLDSGRFIKKDGIGQIIYYDGGRRCVAVFQCSRAPLIYEKIETEGVVEGIDKSEGLDECESQDVTLRFIEFLGAGKNFHGIPTTPKMLGWKNGLRVTFVHSKVIKVGPNEIIPIVTPVM